MKEDKMCHPAIVMGVGMAISAIGTVQQASAQKTAGEAANSAAQYRAKVGEQNAAIARGNADRAFLAGRQKASSKGVEAAASKARFIASSAGQGVEVGSESIDDVVGDITGIGALDQLTLTHQGIREAANFNQQASNLAAGAALDRVSGQNALINASNKARGTLISGLGKTTSSVASKWGNFANTPAQGTAGD